MRVFFGLSLILGSIGVPLHLTAQQNPLDELIFEPIVTGLQGPVTIAHAGDGSGRLLIVEQEGRILVYNGARVLETPFLDIVSQVGCCGERGLLGLAFHPDHENNGLFYVYYIDRSRFPGDSILSRFQVSDDPNIAAAGSEVVLLTVNQPAAHHNAGQLEFGPDGFLYLSLGEGGGHDDPTDRAQRLDSLLGKILRIDVDKGEPYSIPVTNPFVGQPDARAEIWVSGLRNPWRFSFDRLTGDLFISDVGSDPPDGLEEVNFQPADSRGGENYGWGLMEGSQCLSRDINCEDLSLTPPILQYPRNVGERPFPQPGRQHCTAVISGYRYRGVESPQFNGLFFYGDLCSGLLYGATEDAAGWTIVGTRDTDFLISTFGEDEGGELYVADLEVLPAPGGPLTPFPTGTIYRITSNRPVPRLSLLSPTGTVAAGPDFSVTLVGSNFVPGSEVWWNGEPRPTVFVDNSRLKASVSAADIAAEGSAQVTVFNPGPGGGITSPFEFPVRAAPTVSPRINAGGVVEAASFAPGAAVAPGSIVSVFGADLAERTDIARAHPLPTGLGGAVWRFNETVPVPVFYSSAEQANVQVPWELEGGRQASLTVSIGPRTSSPITVALDSVSPGLFGLDGTGSGQGAILIAGSGGAVAAPEGLLAGSRPARCGEDIIEIFAGGLGPVTDPPESGAASTLPVTETTNPPTVTVGGVTAPVLFSGLAPGFVGLYQVNARLPDDCAGGESVPVVLTMGELPSNTVTVALEAIEE